MLEELMHWLGLGLCHQLPERSLFGGGVQLPVCARDTGIYVGFAVALLVLWLLDRGRRSSGVPPFGISVVLGLLVLLMAVDGFSSYAGWRQTTNELRLLTGLMAGYAMAAFTAPLLNGQLWRRPGSTRILGTWREFVLFVLAIAVTYILVWFGGPALGIIYPVATSVAILVTFSTVNGVIVALFPPFERSFTRFVDTWPVFLLGLGLTIIELAAASLLKVWLIRLAELAT